jgi:biopolymer transport protein ExbD
MSQPRLFRGNYLCFVLVLPLLVGCARAPASFIGGGQSTSPTTAASAGATGLKPLPDDFVALKLNAQGALLMPGDDVPVTSQAEIKYYLATEFQTAQRAAEARRAKRVSTTVIIVAPEDTIFEKVEQVRKQSMEAGFRRWRFCAGTEYWETRLPIVDISTEPGNAENAELTIRLKALPAGLAKGSIQSIAVQSKGVESSVASLTALENELKNKRAALATKQAARVLADKELKYAYFVQALDTCLRAGFRLALSTGVENAQP